MNKKTLTTEEHLGEVNILGNVFKVLGCRDTGMVDPDREMMAVGSYRGRTKTIRLFLGTPDYPRTETEILETLIHEILHDILGSIGILDKLANDEKETFISTLSPIFVDTLARNNLINLNWRKKK